MNDYATVEQYVTPLAYALRRQYPAVPVEDIAQELYEWWAKNPRKAKEYLAHDDQRQGDRLIGRALTNRGRRFCLRETAVRQGYEYRDLAFYSEAQLTEELLPAVFDREAWTNPPKPEREETSSRRDPAEGSNWIAALADCADAFRKLPARQRLVIEMRYRDGMTGVKIAQALGVSEWTVSNDLDKAVSGMVRSLGGERPVVDPDEIVGSRRVISNAAAQAITGTDYAGE